MKLRDSLLAEFEHEAQTTRRHLERLPDDKLDWRPHPKSFAARALVSHILECVRWGEAIFKQDEYVFDPATYNHYQITSVADLLQTFDADAANCQRALAAVTEAALTQTWRMKVGGRTVVERTKMDVFRDFTLSHLIHHRGQLSVYLRLLDVAVPGSYGPSADEKF
ncbi:MAG: DinB family protein [Acidobacteria bacterium]|nr:DinB family protein [Acidobacteriota bacterium]MBI3423847.1 DinB family protein [Acidobacteriota bacterium]